MIKQSTATIKSDRNMRGIFIVEVKAALDERRVSCEHVFPNGRTQTEVFFFTDSARCEEGTLLDVQPSLNGYGTAFTILGETPAEIAEKYREEVKKWKTDVVQ